MALWEGNPSDEKNQRGETYRSNPRARSGNRRERMMDLTYLALMYHSRNLELIKTITCSKIPLIKALFPSVC